jgi:hypothetical protein
VRPARYPEVVTSIGANHNYGHGGIGIELGQRVAV